MRKFAYFLIGFALASGLCLSLHKCNDENDPYVTTYDTVTVFKHDTVRIPLPSETTIMPIRTDTVWLQPVVNDTINGTVNDSVTFPLNPMAVEIPISQHIYDGKGYKAWVSGYAAKLDSLWLERTEVEQTIFIKEKRSRWGLSVSAGTAITPRGFEPYIGAGLSYTFISF